MGKTYKILDNTEPMSIEEIKEEYHGYWVYMVNVRFSETRKILSGIPVVIGKTAFDGVEDGIYDKYKDQRYVERADLSLLPNEGFISSLASVR